MTPNRNKYLEKISEFTELEKQAFDPITGALAVGKAISHTGLIHVGQNAIMRKALGSKILAKHVSNGFSEGLKGVVDKSIVGKAKSLASGALLPEFHIMHSYAHSLGRAMSPILSKATKRQKVGLRLLSQGKFDKLHKHKLSSDPVVNKSYNLLQSHMKSKGVDVPDLRHMVENSDKIKKVWQSKESPLTSNILANIHKGHETTGSHFVHGKPSVVPATIGGALTGLADPVTGMFNTMKNTLVSAAADKNKYLKKVKSFLNTQFIEHPIEKGIHHAGEAFNSLKDKVQELGVNPMSVSLKRTASSLTDAVKKQ